MNTELSPEINRTCSNTHGKNANNKSSDFAEITSGCNVQSYQTSCYSKLSWQTKTWHANTKDKEQNSVTELIPKINSKDSSIHANMASNMTDYRLKITGHGRNTDKQACW